MKRIILVISIAILAAAGQKAAAQESVVAAEAHLDYRFDKATFDPSYMGNAQAVNVLRHAVDSIGPANVDSMMVYCYASPEGVYERNLRLAKLRTNMTVALLNREFPDLRGKTFGHASGESWLALRDYVSKDTKLSDESKAKIYAVIDSDINFGTKKWRMENRLGNDPAVGAVYPYLLRTYYKIIRNATILVYKQKDSDRWGVCILKDEALSESLKVALDLVDEVELPELEEVELELPDNLFSFKEKKTIFALKTNLLYDALTMVNAEVEIPIGKRWSVMIEDVFPWWEFSKNKYALQNWEMGAEARFWFRKWKRDDQKLRGFFVGPYGMSGRGDFQYDKIGCYQVHYWSSGLSAGYCIGLGRSKKASLEFSISGGYLNSAYQHYQPSSDYSELIIDRTRAGRVSYFGPTKAKISLVIPINVTKKK